MRRLMLFALSAALVSAAAAAAARTLIVGSISEKPDQEIKTYLPFAQYLARELKDAGVDRGKVVIAASIPEMAEKLRAQQVDIFLDSPFPTIAVSRLADSRILLRRWKKGQPQFHSVFVVRADSPVRSLADLKGKTVAFEDPYSTTGYFLPKSALLEAKHFLRHGAGGSGQIAPHEVGYLFSGEKETTLLWVWRGRVAAGAVGIHDYEQFRRGQPDALRVIHETENVPRHLVSHRKDLDPSLVKRIREVLLAMADSEQGRIVLAGFERTTRFDELPGGTEKSLAPLLRLGKEIDKEVSAR